MKTEEHQPSVLPKLTSNAEPTAGLEFQTCTGPVAGRSHNTITGKPAKNTHPPISTLPSELIAATLLLSVPILDIISVPYDSGDYQSYMKIIYGLRSVSRLWRDVVDGTPSLWTVVSSTFPPEVIDTSLSRSGACSLCIHYLGSHEDRDCLSNFQHFLQIVGPHGPRCVSASMLLPRAAVSQSIILPFPRLFSIKMSMSLRGEWAPPESILPGTPAIEIMDGSLTHVRNVELDCVPICWPIVLGRLGGLKRLELRTIHGHGITTQLISEALANSSELEVLVLIDVGAQPPSDQFSTAACRVHFPLLTSLTICSDEDLVIWALHYIQVEPERMKYLNIRFLHPWEANQALTAAVWTEAMAAFIPAVQRLYSISLEAKISLYWEDCCHWESRSDDPRLCLGTNSLPNEEALRWIKDVVDTIDFNGSKLPGILVEGLLATLALENTVSSLKFMENITQIDGQSSWNNTEDTIQPFLDALAGSESDDDDSSADETTFRQLQYLNFRSWTFGLDHMYNALHRRYSKGSTRRQIPDLSLDLSSSVFPYYGSEEVKAIVCFDTVEKIRKIRGVKALKWGCILEQDIGLLAVVWDDEQGIPVWG